jgi:hypothetical protein
MPSTCCALWIGPALGPVEVACLRSALRHGHEVALYAYESPAGLPEGVTLRDAAEIVPASRIVSHARGSFALFADLFRFELLRRGLGTWIDCDVYFLGALPPGDWLMGREDEDGRIGTAVLRMPADSPVLPPLLALFDERKVPPWIGRRERARAHVRRWRTGRTGLARMPWGTAGPLGLTALARRHGLDRHALPTDALYPVHWSDADWICDPSRSLEQMTTPRTVAVHLFNHLIHRFKHAPAPPGSFLARLHEEGRPD